MTQALASRWSRVLISTTFLAALLLALGIGLLTAQGSAASTMGSGSSAWSRAAPHVKNGPVEFSGVARPGDHVRIFQGETQLGETVAGADGKWQLAVTVLPSGREDLRVQVAPATAVSESRGGGAPEPPEPVEPVTIFISVVASGQRVTVTVVVNSPNGEVSVVVSVPAGECPDSPPCPNVCEVCEDKCGSCAQSHTVRWGDTLAKIARRYGTTALSLARLNGLRNPNLIFPGQKLCVRSS